MQFKTISPEVSVSPQIAAQDIAAIKAAGYRAIICNRSDRECPDQPSFEEIEAAARSEGIEARYVPIESGMVTDQDVTAFGHALADVQRPVLAYCRSGTRSATLWSLHEAKKRPLPEILAMAKAAGYDMAGIARRVANGGKTPTDTGDAHYGVVIVGAGAARRRLRPTLSASHRWPIRRGGSMWIRQRCATRALTTSGRWAT